jgi:type II secretory ATPase GspE/PulE/Tfp pilus assembly ATPase PilB-like protein
MQNDIPKNEEGDWFIKILKSAFSQKASDIHIEPGQDNVSIRFRIDGALNTYETLPIDSINMLVSRIKVLAELDITNHKLPQDGHIQFTHEDKKFSLRISTMPTQYGETIVLRILNRETMLESIQTMGFEKLQIELLEQILLSPNGLLLTTGPTGSGKSTLLYTLLNKLDTPDRNIVTVEDPVEYNVPHITQSQINERIGLDYNILLRSILRQDPDIIMVGEIRDKETLLMTMQAALSGVFVLSSFHAFDIPALVVRLTELGITRSVIAQSIRSVISTRLLRKNCTACLTQHNLTELELRFLGPNYNNIIFKKSKGCETCRGTGYLGRTGVFEIVPFNYDLKSLIIDNKPLSSYYELMSRGNIRSLKQVGIQKAVEGITTIDEVIRKIGF